MNSQEQIISILHNSAPADASAAPAPLPADPAPAPASANRPKVLVIDDEPYLRVFMRKVLERAGYAVTEAAGGREGIRLFSAILPACVITDMKMPEKDGMEMIMEIRRHVHLTRILAISGGFDGYTPVCLKTARLLGADATLHKPFSAVDLVTIVNRLVPPDRSAATG